MEKEKQLTPMMVQYNSIKSKYKDEVLFYRLGDFYEMFNEDAVEISRLLNLTLTSRAGTPMCGIPYHAAKIYIARLLRLGKKIVVCEQVEETVGGKGIAERKVSEIITPGTAMEAEYLEGNSNNYLAAFAVVHGKAAFAFIDVTTSAFSATSWKASEMEEFFPKELSRCFPRELLLPQSLKNNSLIQTVLSEYQNISLSYYPDWNFNADVGFKKLARQFNTINLQSFGLSEDSPEVPVAGFLLDYLEKTTNSKIPHVSGITIYHDNQYLVIDDSSRKNLEVVANLRDGSSLYTLIECVNHSRTAMGSRMIRQWLLFPLTNVNEINARQAHVALFVDNRNLQEKLREKLSSILDVERLVSRIAMDKAHPKDLQALKLSLIGWLNAREILCDYDFSLIDDELALNIIDLIDKSIQEDPAVIITDGGVIKEGWSSELDHWRKIRDNFDKILSEYEQEEREKTGITTLKIKYNHAAGYFIEVSKGKLSSVPENFIMRRALVNGDRYTTERLQELEHELNQSGAKIVELERKLFVEIRTKLQEFISYLLQVSSEIAYTDATVSLAYAAITNAWTRPVVNDSFDFIVESGRHPVVELHIPSGEFVPNDLDISSSQEPQKSSFGLITGPNMAGKSTFLRQNALIALLAQTGSFVPAKNAVVGVVDRIFCRVGASDNLARGESTFLVEMTETANILRSATERSLVIMDEVGRGTSTEDGLSIAWAVSEYLLNHIKCRTLFATHYHELTRIEHDALSLLCMDVSEQNGSVVFLRKVKKGASENSYGIHVAKLAGIPQVVIDRANSILEHIQSIAENKPVLGNIPIVEQPKVVPQAPGLFSDEEIILDEILSAEPDNMTPLAALQAIARWKKALSGQ